MAETVITCSFMRVLLQHEVNHSKKPSPKLGLNSQLAS